MKWSPTQPPQVFTAVSLALIAAMVIAVSLGQSVFFRDALIEREADIMHDMVSALASENLTQQDFERYTEPAAKLEFKNALSSLTHVSGVVRLKVYNSKNLIVWSDAPELVGRILDKKPEHLARMWAGRPSGIFDPTTRPSFAADKLPGVPMIEFYVPFTIKGSDGSGGETNGIVAVYRKADSLTDTLERGILLLSLIAAIGGTLLFLALFHLFRSVYRRQREAESQFARLSSKHERIVQMEKLSAVGHMVAEIAHQFNNPLVGVINLTQLAEREVDKPERVLELLGDIRKAGHHCSDFVQRMLRFTQLARCTPVPTRLGDLVGDTIRFYTLSCGDSTPVKFDAQDEAMLAVDPVLLRHALFNLINNAAQANPGGQVEVSLAAETHNGAAGWAIAVSDRGPGLTPDVMKHLFTPFFSTRKDGTGLGLAVANQIAAVHGGWLRAENRQNGGARFVIWLPTTSEKDEAENIAG